MKMRAPSTPIVNIDPYFSVWCTDPYRFTPLTHWTGSPNSMMGYAFVDGEEFRFLGGLSPAHKKGRMQIEQVDVTACSSTIVASNEKIRLTAKFTSPLLAEDLYLSSRPVAYCQVRYQSLDGKPHRVAVKFTCSEQLVLNTAGEGRAFSRRVEVEGLTAIKMGNGKQTPLWRSGDNLRIDWGFLYMAAVGEATADNESQKDMYYIFVEKALQEQEPALFLFAYDDIDSIEYFGEHLKAYWKKDGKTIEEALAEAAGEYDTLQAKCDAFSQKLYDQAVEKGSLEYAELLWLAYRQVMAGHKLVVDTEGNNLYVSKECFSNGCAATVDVTYPSAPMYLLYNTELLKGMLRPIFRFARSADWEFDFAPHDVGQYPLLNGQVYGKNMENSYRYYQMPVEECGNMIILMAAICDAEDSVEFALPQMDLLEQWSKYLLKYGLDPEDQLCTDDFAGRLSHNVNLAIKATMGIAAYGRILARLGKAAEAEELRNTAKTYAKSIEERALNADGSYRLTFDTPDTFSLKYNAVWDKIWGTELFSKDFFAGEIGRYKKEMQLFGVPLDSRDLITKSDWILWSACLAEKREDFCFLTAGLWRAYNAMRTGAPMTDCYYVDSAFDRRFRHRTVQGGLFIRLMMP